MGKIRANRHGYLYFDFMLNGIRCREGTKYKDIPKHRKLLTAKMQLFDEAIRNGTFDYCSTFPNGNKAHIFEPDNINRQNFETAYQSWLKGKYDPERKDNIIRLTTYLDYKNIGKKVLVPFFKNMNVNEISIEKIKVFAGTLRGLSATRKKHIISALRGFLNDMEIDIDWVRLQKKKVFGNLTIIKKEINPFSLDDIQVFLENCPEFYRDYYIVAFYTGMRPSEQIALKWSNVDMRHRYFSIKESKTLYEESFPKTKKSIRDVKMTSAVYEAFLNQREKTLNKSQYVFVCPKIKPINLCSLNRYVWKETLTKAGLAYRNPYQTRHTAITLMLMSGEDPYWVADQTGTSIDMISRHYFKYIKNMIRPDGKSYDRFISGDNISFPKG